MGHGITSNPLSKDVKISWVIYNSWLIQELPVTGNRIGF